MDWLAIGTVASLVGVVVSGALSTVAIRGQNASDEIAREANVKAGDAVLAAEDAADQARRSADALERIATTSEAEQIAAARAEPKPVAAWHLEFSGGSTYTLSNVGTGAAHDVAIEPGVSTIFRGVRNHAEIGPGSAVKLLVVQPWQVGDDGLKVTWCAESGGADRKTWTRPLPPKR